MVVLIMKPGCAYCKRIRPEWQAAAAALQKVGIATQECTREMASVRYGVRAQLVPVMLYARDNNVISVFGDSKWKSDDITSHIMRMHSMPVSTSQQQPQQLQDEQTDGSPNDPKPVLAFDVDKVLTCFGCDQEKHKTSLEEMIRAAKREGFVFGLNTARRTSSASALHGNGKIREMGLRPYVINAFTSNGINVDDNLPVCMRKKGENVQDRKRRCLFEIASYHNDNIKQPLPLSSATASAPAPRQRQFASPTATAILVDDLASNIDAVGGMQGKHDEETGMSTVGVHVADENGVTPREVARLQEAMLNLKKLKNLKTLRQML